MNQPFNLVKDISRKIELELTIMMFLIIVIKTFFDIYKPESASMMYLYYSALVAIYLFIYLTFEGVKYVLHKHRIISYIINFLLILSFLFTGLIILYMLNIDKCLPSVKSVWCSMVFLKVLFIGVCYVIPSLILLLFIFIIIKYGLKGHYKMVHKVKNILQKHNIQIISILLFILGIFCLYWSSLQSEFLEGKVYMTEFGLNSQDFNDDGSNKIHIQDFVFYYDFTKKEGSVSFVLGEHLENISNIEIEFPVEINKKDLQVYLLKEGNKEYLQEESLNYYHSGEDENKVVRIYITDLPSPLKGDKFFIEFKAYMEPKGVFVFIHLTHNYFHEGHQKGTVNFILGEDYDCDTPCVYALRDAEETLWSFDRNISIKFLNQETQNSHLFKLSAISRKKRFEQTLCLSFGVSLIVSAAVLLVPYLTRKKYE